MNEFLDYAILLAVSFGMSLALTAWLHRRERRASKELKLKWFEAGVKCGILKEQLDAEERRIDAEMAAIRLREAIKEVHP